ncbi:tetratricopeptide repeat protein [Dactylosporangium aurantiacum]|uniref:Tetratricopeptide repeat protein n=1 Tax=Dactylosporangium aurantiacum TaxID=35754 RepID=A0A9Q9I756_9ACTN|nr:BTAD domain-containing putative transcriptional regulator [Dactylosporangium aurantiacum]MDG6106423.1 BTAD domain-containing putative transcriptional regulator [Dactylosporangium aurantiacum]UWZ50537.1 tetratricopeptide repeat protein [Dactylosporangium aurantiacum]
MADSAGRIRIRLLGGVTAGIDHGQGEVAVDLGHERQRCVLAALLVEPGRPVPADVLLDRAWGERLPRHPRDTLYSYLSRLRAALAGGGCAVLRRASGYVVQVDPLDVDLHLFDDLVRRAGTATDGGAFDLLGTALGLWTGDAFGGLDTPWLDGVRRELHRRRRGAQHWHAELALRLDRHAEVLDALLARADADPLDERLAGAALQALHRCGRRSEALARYAELRRQLAEQLGVEPGDELRDLHRRMVRPAGELPAVARPAGGPQQVPAPPAAFTGRAAQLAEVTAAVRATGGGSAAGPVVVIGGPGGVGKTWLALRWAHEYRDRFPDGRLYVHLRGFDPAAEPLCPQAATRRFLAALGVAAEALPADADERQALLRQLLAGRRMLVVLDDARDSAQVVPLLPGSPTVTVLVTSRRRLTGLVAAHGARPVLLGCMTAAEAAELLRARLGAARLAAEPAAAAALLPLCAGLPLALGIVAARAATDPHGRLGTLVAELTARRTRLDALDAGDLAMSLRTVMAGSVRHLTAPAAELFGLLSLGPGPDIGGPAAASLAGRPAAGRWPELRELLDAGLVAEDPPGRFRMHDLVRLYGMELAGAGARGAVRRLLDHYVHSACAAAGLLEPLRDPLPLPPPLPGVRPETFGDRRAAAAWFEAHEQVLPAAVRLAGGAGFDRHAWQLAWAMVYVLDQHGDWHGQVDVHVTAVRSARRLGDDTALAHAHRGLARVYTWLRRFDEARAELAAALAAYRRLGDEAGQGFVYRSLARVSARQGRPDRALTDDRRALAMFDAAGHEHGRAQTLNALGWHLAHLGAHEDAVRCCARAIALQQRLGDRHGEGLTWDTLAYSRHRSGLPGQAVRCYERAAALLREQGDRYQEAVVTEHLGDVYAALGDQAQARAAWRRSAGLLAALGHPDAGAVRAKAAPPAPAPPHA